MCYLAYWHSRYKYLGENFNRLASLEQIVFWGEYIAAKRRQMGGAKLHPLFFMPLAGNGQGHFRFSVLAK